jgi:glycosyltransferase involved in cell wall biosynthesis
MSEKINEMVMLVEKPLVTFALFAYNQEKFITEAVEAAFAQTYQPLEIIISDDGSSDKTYEIIVSLVQSYQGPHIVKAIQTESNKGILSHVLSVVNKSHGDLIVVAAGDDISEKNRVTSLFEAWKLTGSWALMSRFTRINDAGEIESENCISEMRKNEIRNYFVDGQSMTLIHGATAAYDRRAFDFLFPDHEGVMNEDAVMGFLLHSYGKSVSLVDQSLVRYRSHSSSLSNSNLVELNAEQILFSEKRGSSLASGFINLNNLFLNTSDELARVDPNAYKSILIGNINRQTKFYIIWGSWIDAGFLVRMRFLLTSLRGQDIRWMLPRIFGVEVFVKIKLLILKLR